MLNWYGDDVVALVWSFTNEFQDIPYRISYLAVKSKNNTVNKKWVCTCPAFVHRKNCKHLTLLKENIKNKSVFSDKRFTITDFGKSLFQ